MDKELHLQLLPYFDNANDGTSQADYLSELAPKEAQDGICLNLVLSWILLYKRAGGAKAPNTVWEEMKNPATIKQIANNQVAYQKLHHSDVDENIRLLGLNSNTSVRFALSEELPFYMNVTLNHTTLNFIIIDLYRSGKRVGSHAIGFIAHGAGAAQKLYMFDPNIGVLRVPYDNKDELIGKVSYIYETYYGYKINGKSIYEIA